MLAAACLSAGATSAQALLASGTAWFARKAFQAQSDEVRTLKEQLRDQQDLSAKQTPVLELQAQELRESLAERKREADERRRTQAAHMYIAVTTFPDSGSDARSTALAATVHNTSDQPIYNAEVHWLRGTAPDGDPYSCDVLLPGGIIRQQHAFPAGTNMEHASAVVRFTDAARVRWIRRPDGTLLDDRQQA